MSVTRFVMNVIEEHDVATDAINWFEGMPESMNICVSDHDGNLRILDISSALTLYSGDHAPWFVPIDTSGALMELEQELGFDADTFLSQVDQCFRLYAEALADANTAYSHLYTYSRRFDAAHVWSTCIPESIRSQAGEAVQNEIKTYLRTVGDGMLLRETLTKYGKAMIKVNKLKTLLNNLNNATEIVAVAEDIPEPLVGVSVTEIGSHSALTATSLPTLPQCRQCGERDANYVTIPCGHLLCLSCLPLSSETECPQCGGVVTSRQRINLFTEI